MAKYNFKKTLAGVFAVAIVASSVPLAPYTNVLNSISITASAEAAEITSWEDLQKRIENAAAGEETRITLTQDLTDIAENGAIVVRKDQVIILDLNGFTLDRALSVQDEDGCVIKNSGTLTICDGSTAQSGTITGGYNTSGGGIVNDSGTLTINGGTITGNNATTNGGGIYNNGTLTLEGGSITGNNATTFGGGIYSSQPMTVTGGSITGNNANRGGGIYALQSMTVTGGNITGNNAADSGGGIYGGPRGSLTILGGTITGNSSKSLGGGVYSSKITIGGAPVIKGNVDASKVVSNLDFPKGNKAYVSTDTPLTKGADIGITVYCDAMVTDQKDEFIGTDVSAYIDGLTDANAKYFFISVHSSPTNRLYRITKDGEQFVVAPRGCKVTFDMNGQGSDIDEQYIQNGESAVSPAAPVADGYCFGGWFTDAECTESNQFDFDNTAITEDITLYAKWDKSKGVIPNSNLTWEIDAEGVMTISGDDTAFPDFYDPEEPLMWCALLESVTKVVFDTPNMTTLGSAAFFDFSSLTTIELPDTLTTISFCSFSYCTALKSITIPDGVTSIDDFAFEECESLESVTIPDSVTSIGEAAFSDCISLKSITIPDSVSSIGEDAFFMCQSLESITISDSVTSIGKGSFIGCESLESVTIPDSVTSIGEAAFFYCTSLKSITIPDSVTSIGEAAFATCTSLKSITIPDSVTSIGEGAFSECISLESITIPNSVTSIDNFTFQECESLESVTIPDSVTSIGEAAFATCTSLKSITIPASVSNVVMNAFAMSGLKSVSFECDDADAIADFNPQKYRNIFNGCESLEKIYVPVGCAEAYEASEGYQYALGDYSDLLQEMPTVKVKGMSAEVNGDITLFLHYDIPEALKNGYVKFSDGTVVYTSSIDLYCYYDGAPAFPISMPAKNMYDTYTAQYYDENGVAIGEAIEFSLADYLDGVKTTLSWASDFVDCFLDYGAQAAAYFGVEGAPAGKTDYDYVTICNNLASYETVDMGENFVGATLLLKSSPIIRLYYDTEVEGSTASDNNAGLYYVEQEFAMVDLNWYDLNGYSVFHYIYKALQTDNDKLKALCAALYKLIDAAYYQAM